MTLREPISTLAFSVFLREHNSSPGNNRGLLFCPLFVNYYIRPFS